MTDVFAMENLENCYQHTKVGSADALWQSASFVDGVEKVAHLCVFQDQNLGSLQLSLIVLADTLASDIDDSNNVVMIEGSQVFQLVLQASYLGFLIEDLGSEGFAIPFAQHHLGVLAFAKGALDFKLIYLYDSFKLVFVHTDNVLTIKSLVI